MQVRAILLSDFDFAHHSYSLILKNDCSGIYRRVEEGVDVRRGALNTQHPILAIHFDLRRTFSVVSQQLCDTTHLPSQDIFNHTVSHCPCGVGDTYTRVARRDTQTAVQTHARHGAFVAAQMM